MKKLSKLLTVLLTVLTALCCFACSFSLGDATGLEDLHLTSEEISLQMNNENDGDPFDKVICEFATQGDLSYTYNDVEVTITVPVKVQKDDASPVVEKTVSFKFSLDRNGKCDSRKEAGLGDTYTVIVEMGENVTYSYTGYAEENN